MSVTEADIVSSVVASHGALTSHLGIPSDLTLIPWFSSGIDDHEVPPPPSYDNVASQNMRKYDNSLAESDQSVCISHQICIDCKMNQQRALF